QQSAPVHGRHAVRIVVEQRRAQTIAEREHGREGPGVADQRAEDGVDAVQPEEEREGESQQKVEAHERREADPHAERHGGCDVLERLLAPEPLEQQDSATPPPGQRMAEALLERSGQVEGHGRSSRWSNPSCDMSRSPAASDSAAPEPSRQAPTRRTATPVRAARASRAAEAASGAVKSNS